MKRKIFFGGGRKTTLGRQHNIAVQYTVYSWKKRINIIAQLRRPEGPPSGAP